MQTDPQYEIISKLTPQARFKLATDLYWSARKLKAAWLKHLHPDWSPQQIDKAVKDIFLHARS